MIAIRKYMMAMRKIYILYLADWGSFCFLRFVPKKETIYIHVIGYQGYKVQGKYLIVFTLVRHFLMQCTLYLRTSLWCGGTWEQWLPQLLQGKQTLTPKSRRRRIHWNLCREWFKMICLIVHVSLCNISKKKNMAIKLPKFYYKNCLIYKFWSYTYPLICS